LALGSGAARGWAHIGVLHALAELGITPDVICGTSIGALVGGFHVTGFLADLEEWARKLTKLRMVRYLDFRVASNGMIAGNRLFAEMESRIADTRIEDLPHPFAVIATDLYTGHEVWYTEGEMVPAIRASFSLPGLFEPARVGERWVIDGALVNPVPVSVCHALGAQIVIAINLNTPPSRNGKAHSLPIGTGRLGPLPGATNGFLRKSAGRLARRKSDESAPEPDAPSLMGVLASTMNLVQDRVTRSRLAADPPDVNIVPKLGHVGLLDFHLASECIEAGAASIYQAESDIREALTLFELEPA
jgi:NTE family protein